jgi:hypothetical protein
MLKNELKYGQDFAVSMPQIVTKLRNKRNDFAARMPQNVMYTWRHTELQWNQEFGIKLTHCTISVDGGDSTPTSQPLYLWLSPSHPHCHHFPHLL